MQSCTAVAAHPASSACPRPVDAPGHSRKYNRGPTRTHVSVRPNILDLPERVQSTPQRDFHLDTFFNRVWVAGPHAFSFAKDGTIVRLEPGRMASWAGHQPPVVPCSGRGFDKAWKNVAITEQDDAEFAAIQVAEEMRKRAEAKAKLVGRVYNWPPKRQPAPCEECAVLAGARPTIGRGLGLGGMGRGMGRSRNRGAEESVVPGLSWSSGESELESEVSRVVPRQVRQWEDLRKPAPPPSLIGTDDGESESRWARSEVARGVGEVYGNGVLSPSTEQWVEDQLIVELKEILKMPGM